MIKDQKGTLLNFSQRIKINYQVIESITNKNLIDSAIRLTSGLTIKNAKQEDRGGRSTSYASKLILNKAATF
jgi:hypothetical protein